jgi:ribosomal protein L11 methyltransferase
VLHKIDLFEQDVTKLSRRSGWKYYLVCANLISNLLIQERDRIIQRVAPGGTLVLAGILANEFRAVARAFARRGMRIVTQRRQKGWCSGTFRKF